MMKLDDIRMGTLGGTLCSIWASLTLGDLFQTVLTAVLGTFVSYGVGRLINRWRKKE